MPPYDQDYEKPRAHRGLHLAALYRVIKILTGTIPIFEKALSLFPKNTFYISMLYIGLFFNFGMVIAFYKDKFTLVQLTHTAAEFITKISGNIRAQPKGNYFCNS